MATLLMIIWALAMWAHPTNTISPAFAGAIEVEFGTGITGAYPGGDGAPHIVINEAAWELYTPEQRRWIILHEVGHTLGIWGEPPAYNSHFGNGVMAGSMNCEQDTYEPFCKITASDRFRMETLHPSPIVRRAVVPMISQ